MPDKSSESNESSSIKEKLVKNLDEKDQKDIDKMQYIENSKDCDGIINERAIYENQDNDLSYLFNQKVIFKELDKAKKD